MGRGDLGGNVKKNKLTRESVMEALEPLAEAGAGIVVIWEEGDQLVSSFCVQKHADIDVIRYMAEIAKALKHSQGPSDELPEMREPEPTGELN